MKYKAQYEPSQLLCPVTFQWVDLKDCTTKLDNDKFCAFADTTETRPKQTVQEKVCTETEVQVLLDRKAFPLQALLRAGITLKQDKLELVQKFCNTVGENATDGTILYFLSSSDVVMK
jgi:hypothetical protein